MPNRLRSLALVAVAALLAALLAACASPREEEPDVASQVAKGEGEAEQALVVTGPGGICTPAPAATDGCTTMDIEYVHPRVAAFKGTFTGQCITHDRCYGSLGANVDECDGAFRSAMLDRCNDQFNKYFRPVEWSECRMAAEDFYAGVRLYGYVTSAKGFASYQVDARRRSQAMGAQVEAETCGTTPEWAQIHHPRLIAEVDRRFRAATGRGPTVFEFFKAVHVADPLGDPQAWGTAVDGYARTRASITPPAVGYTRSDEDEIVLRVVSPSPTVTYRFGFPGRSGLTTSASFPFHRPKYTENWQIGGVLVARDAWGNRNLAIVHEFVREQGSCAEKPGVPCRYSSQ